MTGYGGNPIGMRTVIYANSNQCNVFNAFGHSGTWVPRDLPSPLLFHPR